MKILALDLSTGCGSLAWLDDTERDPARKAVVQTWPNDRKNSGAFFGALQQTIGKFGLPDRIVVGLGPGSYAGIRIAISTAVGLEAAARAQLFGYPSVCAMPIQNIDYSVIGDARRQSFFFVRIKSRTVTGDYELLNEHALRQRIESLRDIPVLSADQLAQFKPQVVQAFPSADILAQLALRGGDNFVRPPLEPIYLREANVTMPKPIPSGPTR